MTANRESKIYGLTRAGDRRWVDIEDSALAAFGSSAKVMVLDFGDRIPGVIAYDGRGFAVRTDTDVHGDLVYVRRRG